MTVSRRGILASAQHGSRLILPSSSPPPPPGSTLPNVASGVLVPQLTEMGPGGIANGEFTSMYNPALAYGGLDLTTWQPWMYGNNQVQNSPTKITLNDTTSQPLTIIQSDGLHIGLDQRSSPPISGAVASAKGAAHAPGTGTYTGYNMGPPTGSNGIFYEVYASCYNNGANLLDWQTIWAAADPTGAGFTPWPGCGEWDTMESGLVAFGEPGATIIAGHFASGPFAGGINNGPGGTAVTTTSPMLSGAITWGLLWTPTGCTVYYNGIQVYTQLNSGSGYNGWGVSGYTPCPMFPVVFPSAGGGPTSTGRHDMIVKYIRTWTGPLVAHP